MRKDNTIERPPVRMFEKAAAFACDFILMFAGLALLAQLFVPAFAISAALALLRFNSKFRRSRILSIPYWALVALTLDTAFLHSVLAVFSAGPVQLLIPVAAYFVTLYIRKKKGVFSYLSPLHLTLVPIVICGVIATRPFDPNIGMTCEDVSSQPGARVISDSRDVPRFIKEIPETGAVMVAYKIQPPDPSPFEKNVKPGPAVELLSPDGKPLKKVLESGVPMAMDRDPLSGEIFVVAAKPFRAPKNAETYNMTLVRISPSGDVIDRADLHMPRSTYYSATMFFDGEKAIVGVEDQWRAYDMRSRKVTHVDAAEMTGGSPVYFLADGGDYAIATFTPGYFIISLLTGRKNLKKIDKRELKMIKSSSGSTFGFYDIKRIPGAQRFAVSRAWLRGGALIDSNLNIIRSLKFPSGTRNIGVSSDGKEVFAGGYYDGYVYALNEGTGEVTDKIFAGKRIRSLEAASGGRLLVGSVCGVVEVDVEARRKRREK